MRMGVTMIGAEKPRTAREMTASTHFSLPGYGNIFMVKNSRDLTEIADFCVACRVERVLIWSKHWELIFGEGMGRATFQFSESGGSVNDPNLYTELPFLYISFPNP